MKNGKPELTVRSAQAQDAPAVTDIYNHYVRTTTITFEEEPVTPADMARRIAEVQSKPLPWLVVEQESEVAGYAYATPWKNRTAYRFSVEVTVYTRAGLVGQGIGSALYGELLPLLRTQGIHSAIGGIAIPNEASIALHEKLGFSKVAHFRQVGRKFGEWIDVGYWQLVF